MKIYLAGTSAGHIKQELDNNKLSSYYRRLYSFYDVLKKAFYVDKSIFMIIQINKNEK